MMREVLTRRFSRLQREAGTDDAEAWPDLVLIDGGASTGSTIKGPVRLKNNDYFVLGGSLGGINSAVAAGVIPEVKAWAPIVPGGQLPGATVDASRDRTVALGREKK